MDCRGCRYYHSLADNHCLACDGSDYTRPSHADRIRAMTDKELAEWLSMHLAVRQEYECNQKRTTAWLDWLKEECE